MQIIEMNSEGVYCIISIHMYVYLETYRKAS